MRIPIRLETAESFPSITVPDDLKNHPDVDGKYFYTMPHSLLKLIVDAVRNERFDGDLLRFEFALSELVGDHCYNAGCLNGKLLKYEFLGEQKPLKISEELIARIGLTEETVRKNESTVNQRLKTFGIPGRGYAGWLMANSEFLDEHDDLFKRNREDIRRYGVPKPVMVKLVFGKTTERVASRGDSEPFVFEFRDFCQRWRLQTFAGPYLPVPLEPQVPNVFAVPEGLAACEGMAAFSLPDIFPVCVRGELQSAVDDVVHGGEKPGHLAGWNSIIDSTNTAKNQIHRYGRLFQFQHFVRVLYSRHTTALNRKKTRVRDALADFFRVSEDAIKGDWKFFDDSVGKDWHLRTDPLA